MTTATAHGSSLRPSDVNSARVVADASGSVEDAAIIAAAMARIAARTSTATQWPTVDRRAVLAAMDKTIDGLGTVRAAVLVAERASGDWQGRGDRSFEAWRGRVSKTGPRTATAQVRQAEQLDAVPAVAEAVTQGRIGFEHATIIAKVAATGTPAQRAAAQSAEGQQALVDLAERVDAGTFQVATNRWAAEVDPVQLENDHQAQRAARYFNLTETSRGTMIKGQLDTYAGHLLALAIEAASPKPGADDDREPAQRRADAVETIAMSILASAETKPGAHVPPQVTMILTEETWQAVQAERERQIAAAALCGDPDSAPGAGASAGEADEPTVATTVIGYEPATLQDGTPVPVSELAIAMCECELTRVVIDSAGEPTNLGRTERLFTGVHRWAVIARDRECVWPDCHMHARWSQVHHIDWWQRDAGETSVANGVLLCSFHHHEVHRRNLAIERHTLAEPLAARGQARLRATLARVWYTFHEPGGRGFGHPPTSGPLARTDRTDLFDAVGA